MLAIKLQRIGKKHQPSYRFVVALKKSKMAGPPVEDLGSYNPATKIAALHKDRISYWLQVGAQPTVTAHNLLVKEGVISAPKIAIKMKKAVAKEVAPEAAIATAEAPTPPAVDAAAPVTAEAQVSEVPVTEVPPQDSAA